MVRSLRWSGGLALVAVGGLATAVLAGSVTLSNRNTDGDGRYEVTVDDYGSINGWSGYADFFNPAGSTGRSGVTFLSGTFVFVAGTHRELLSDSSSWQGFSWPGAGWPTAFSADSTLNRSVTAPNAASDSNGDGYNDTSVSQFVLTGTGVDLAFTLNQSVLDGLKPNTAVHKLDYTITNQGDEPLPVRLVRQMDADLALVGGYNDDSVVVGTVVDGTKYVGQNEGGDMTLGYTMWSPRPHDYNALLNGYSDASGSTNYPPGATNGHLWEHWGLPADWTNHGAGLGTMTDGTAGPQEAGSYLQWDVALRPGRSANVEMWITFGDEPPTPEPSTLLLAVSGVLGLAATRRGHRRRR